MSTLIIGTAGHIDHGKSALVRALTGTDPDRLREEKERGITIDLGFAHCGLGEGITASFVDVPGHERFVRNMLAGAHGIDAVLLVVAADESVMPQTREHFEICRLLGTPGGCVALTKCDLADAEMLELAELEVRELVAGSFLEGAPIVRTSARTEQGFGDLREALAALRGAARGRDAAGLVRLPVDRSFSMRGFGTVVTGTLVGGRIGVGDTLVLLPGGQATRVRGLQVHGSPVEAVEAGHRVAVNLTGVEPGAVQRGDVLAAGDTLQPTSMLDVMLQLLEGERALKDQARVRVHVASAEVLARVRLLEAPRLEPGSAGLGQLRLERPVVAGRGDRLVLRAYSPARTIGGARVLDPLPPKRGRRDAAGMGWVRELAEATPGAAAVGFVEAAGARGLTRAELVARVSSPAAALDGALANEPRVQALPDGWLASSALARLSEEARRVLGTFHRDQPLEAGMPSEAVRQRVFRAAAAGAFELAIERLVGAGQVRRQGDALALGSHAVSLSPEEASAHDALAEAARGAGLAGLDAAKGPSLPALSPSVVQRVTRVMLSTGELRRVGSSLLVHGDVLASLKREVRERWPPGSRIDVHEVKELTGLSRKYVIPLLEYLDSERVTRRSGTTRTVIG